MLFRSGWGYATVVYSEIQPDRANAWKDGVIGLTLAPGQTEPHSDEWGTISAWSWGISRIIDYFETDKSVDAKRVAIQGFSRLGKTVLWAGARDTRVAAVFSGCAGELGSALARRDWGETVDDMKDFARPDRSLLIKKRGKSCRTMHTCTGVTASIHLSPVRIIFSKKSQPVHRWPRY